MLFVSGQNQATGIAGSVKPPTSLHMQKPSEEESLKNFLLFSMLG